MYMYVYMYSYNMYMISIVNITYNPYRYIDKTFKHESNALENNVGHYVFKLNFTSVSCRD